MRLHQQMFVTNKKIPYEGEKNETSPDESHAGVKRKRNGDKVNMDRKRQIFEKMERELH